MYLDERPQADDDQHVQSDDAQGKRSIHQRALDENVDIPQSIAQDCDADEEWEKEEQEVRRKETQCIAKRAEMYMKETRQQAIDQSEIEPVAANAQDEAENDPLGLLALHRSGHAPVAIDLQGNLAGNQAKKEDREERGAGGVGAAIGDGG